jgi:hypothetical protein
MNPIETDSPREGDRSLGTERNFLCPTVASTLLLHLFGHQLTLNSPWERHQACKQWTVTQRHTRLLGMMMVGEGTGIVTTLGLMLT